MKTIHFEAGEQLPRFREQLLRFLSQYAYAAYFDSHSGVIPVTGVGYDVIAAAGNRNVFIGETPCIDKLDAFVKLAAERGEWLFGHIGYDFKNEIENLTSAHTDRIEFPVAGFFVPEVMVIIKDSRVELSATENPERIKEQIFDWVITHEPQSGFSFPVPRMCRNQYLDAVRVAQKHIFQGDVYEINLCHEYYSEGVSINPVAVAQRLFDVSPNPFSAYYRCDASHLMCASPERFVTRKGNLLLSQPIKGTAPRSSDVQTDLTLKETLSHSSKEQSENVMIVDLVRNDLSRLAVRASVKVEELFGVYTFPGAHQMISSVSCLVPEATSFCQIIKALFPMGSMTGAPKIRSMEIIDQLEAAKRGLFSGAVGYISPSGDFDFNVVIRSIQYNAASHYLSVMAGGAITAASIPENEYSETLVKLAPQFKALGFELETAVTESHG
ncbi:MAG TPA: anthranilate synthase component I family protein [Bacteroidia bacterium]|nr:anthranilate synthase component I family protein [Bacteroidia bacterium]